MFKPTSLLLNSIRSSFKQICNYKSTEIRIPVPWGHIAGKWWGPTDKRPILTLHGWQDNCGSFNRLIPLLSKEFGFLAIDWPGHGLSSRIQSGLSYDHTLYLVSLQYVISHFQWRKVSLMGHSLGGVTSFLYRTIYPKNVDFLICIDGSKPMIDEIVFPRLAQNFKDFEKFALHEMSKEEPPCYTLDEIKQRVCAPNDGSVDFEHSLHLAERNIAPAKNNPGKYYFTRDPRLKASLSITINVEQDQIEQVAENMTGPIFIAKATKGSYYEDKKNFYDVLDILRKSSVDCQYHRVEGTHHVHLNNPEVLAELINKFICKHGKQDRSFGGITKEIKVGS